MRPQADLSLHHSLAVVARRVPEGVVCLLSTLAFHELTIQLPHGVWLALPPRKAMPQPDYPPLRVVRVSGRAFGEGVDVHVIEQEPVRIYGVAKPVVD